MIPAGVITALITPFDKGAVDYTSFERLLRYQLDQGVDGLVINGTTGESPTLTETEVERLFGVAKSIVAGQVPLILGTGSNCTATTIKATIRAGRAGADAALVVTPYYNKPPQRGLLAHFKAVADASTIPVILYNVPGRTVISIALETVAELAHHPGIVGLKEASGDLDFFKAIKGVVPEDFALLSGDDPTCVRFCELGGTGVISVLSHIIGGELKTLLKAARKRDGTAVKGYNAFNELNRLLYLEANPIPAKAAMYLMKIIRSPELRLPLVTMAEDKMMLLEAELHRLGKAGGKT